MVAGARGVSSHAATVRYRSEKGLRIQQQEIDKTLESKSYVLGTLAISIVERGDCNIYWFLDFQFFCRLKQQ